MSDPHHDGVYSRRTHLSDIPTQQFLRRTTFRQPYHARPAQRTWRNIGVQLHLWHGRHLHECHSTSNSKSNWDTTPMVFHHQQYFNHQPNSWDCLQLHGQFPGLCGSSGCELDPYDSQDELFNLQRVRTVYLVR